MKFDPSNLNTKNIAFLDKQVRLLPLTKDRKLLGKPLENVMVEKGLVTNANITIGKKQETINFIEKVNGQNSILSLTKTTTPNVFDENYDFYFRDSTKPATVLAVKNLDDTHTLKEVYSLSGVKLNYAVDETINDVLVTRSLNNKKLEIRSNSINYIEEKIHFLPINPEKVKRNLVLLQKIHL